MKRKLEKKMGNFSALPPEEQQKMLGSLTADQQQHLIKENKHAFYRNAADNFDKMSAEE